MSRYETDSIKARRAVKTVASEFPSKSTNTQSGRQFDYATTRNTHQIRTIPGGLTPPLLLPFLLGLLPSSSLSPDLPPLPSPRPPLGLPPTHGGTRGASALAPANTRDSPLLLLPRLLAFGAPMPFTTAPEGRGHDCFDKPFACLSVVT